MTWHQIWEEATEGVNRTNAIRRMKAKVKALDWEFLILVFAYNKDKEKRLILTARWEGDAYRIYVWTAEKKQISRIEIDAVDVNKLQRLNMMLKALQVSVGDYEYEIYAYQSIYNPVRDTAIWKEVIL